MALFTRPNSPYYWKRYDTNPETGTPFRPRASTKICVDAPTKEQRAQNLRDAKHQLAQDLIDIRQGILAPTTKAPTVPTYRAWIETHYLKTWTAKHGGKDKETSMLARLVREFGDRALGDFTTDLVRGYRDRRELSVKNTTINREIGLLTATLRRWAQRLRQDGCTAPHSRDILSDLTKLKPKQFAARWFSPAEFARFIDAIDTHDTIAGVPRLEGLALAIMAVETLLRRSSLLKLEWPHYRGTFFTPLDAKVKIDRSPASRNLRQYITALPTTTDRIFASHDRVYQRAKSRGLIISADRRLQSACSHADRWFRAVCDLAGLPCGRAATGLTFHSFRHTGATWYLNGTADRRPVSVKTVMEMGGWKNVRVFMSTYCHTDEKEQDAAAESLFPQGLPGLNRPRLVATADAAHE